ncbi:hypothetical protein B0H19DRAFT_1085331 [Mycena capillaripes]|nr:hypothetical protein B0H19DRAFT_1085331 [Mycena capillaripes]
MEMWRIIPSLTTYMYRILPFLGVHPLTETARSKHVTSRVPSYDHENEGTHNHRTDVPRIVVCLEISGQQIRRGTFANLTTPYYWLLYGKHEPNRTFIGKVLNPELQMLLKPPKIAHIPAPFHAHLTRPGTFDWPNSDDSLLIAHIGPIFLGQVWEVYNKSCRGEAGYITVAESDDRDFVPCLAGAYPAFNGLGVVLFGFRTLSLYYLSLTGIQVAKSVFKSMILQPRRSLSTGALGDLSTTARVFNLRIGSGRTGLELMKVLGPTQALRCYLLTHFPPYTGDFIHLGDHSVFEGINISGRVVIEGRGGWAPPEMPVCGCGEHESEGDGCIADGRPGWRDKLNPVNKAIGECGASVRFCLFGGAYHAAHVVSPWSATPQLRTVLAQSNPLVSELPKLGSVGWRDSCDLQTYA